MTFFSFALVAYVIFVFLLHRNSPKAILHIIALNLMLHLCVNIGYFIRFKYDIDFCNFLDIIILIWGIAKLGLKTKIKKADTNRYALLVLSMLIGIIMLILLPYGNAMVTKDVTWDEYIRGKNELEYVSFTSTNLVYALKFLTVVTNVYFIKMFIPLESWDYILKKVYGWIRIVLAIGIIEAISRYVFQSDIFNTVTIAVFGVTSSTYVKTLTRSGGYMLQGLAREGSHYAFSLAIICIFLYMYKKLDRSSIRWMFVAVTLLAISMTLTAVYALFILIMMKFVCVIFQNNANSIRLWRGVICGTIGLTAITVGGLIILSDSQHISMVSYLVSRLNNALMTFKVILTGEWRSAFGYYASNQLRLISMWETIMLSLHRPLFGFGIGSTSSHSPLATLLVDLGYAGTFCWYRFFFKAGTLQLKSQESKLFNSIIIGYLALTLLSGIEKLSFAMTNMFVYMIAYKMVDYGDLNENHNNNTYTE